MDGSLIDARGGGASGSSHPQDALSFTAEEGRERDCKEGKKGVVLQEQQTQNGPQQSRDLCSTGGGRKE